MKKIIAGLVVGLLIGLASNAFAAVGDIIEAKFSQFTFMVDGTVKELEADPLVYQGSTYLPVRVVANLVGKEVIYRADSRTIELNTPDIKTTVNHGEEVNGLQEDEGMSIEDQIKQINKQIQLKRASVEIIRGGVMPGDEANQQAYDNAVAELADLEAQKEALEAQLQE